MGFSIATVPGPDTDSRGWSFPQLLPRSSFATSSGESWSGTLDQRWTSGAMAAGWHDSRTRMARFKFTAPNTGVSITSLAVSIDFSLAAGSSIGLSAGLIKVAYADANEAYYTKTTAYGTASSANFTNPNGSAPKLVNNVNGSVSVIRTLGYDWGSGQASTVKQKKFTFTTDIQGNAIEKGAQYYVYIYPQTDTFGYYWTVGYGIYHEVAIQPTILTYTNATAAGTPTIKGASGTTIVGNRIIPQKQITLSWTAGNAGTANPISKYEIYYWRAGSGTWTYWAQVAASTLTYTAQLPNNTRGNGFCFKIRVVATYNNADSGTSAYIYNNTLPGVPSVTVASQSTTVPSATSTVKITALSPGSDADGQTITVYKSTANSSTVNSVAAVNNNLTLAASGDSVFRFWSWDGLEYSSAITRTVTRNVKPTISISVTRDATETVTDANYTPVTNYPLANKIKITTTTNKTGGTIYYKTKRASSVAGLENSGSFDLGSSTAASSTTITVTRELSSDFFESLNNFVRPGALYYDGIEYSDNVYVTYGFYGGSTMGATGIWNGLDYATVPGSTATHFKRQISAKYKVNSIATAYIVYSTSSSGTGAVKLGTTTASGSTGQISVPFTSGPTSAGTTYYFWMRTEYPNGQTGASYLGSMKQVPTYIFSGMARTAATSQILEAPATTQTVSFAYGSTDTESYSILTNSFKLYLVRGSQTYQIQPIVADDSVPNTKQFTVTNSLLYPMTLAANSGDDPFSIGFNRTDIVSLRVSVENAFGDLFIGNSPTFTLDLNYTPKIEEGLSGQPYQVNYAASGTESVPIWATATNGMSFFEGRKYSFSFPTAKSRRLVDLTYRIRVGNTASAALTGTVVGTITIPATGVSSTALTYKTNQFISTVQQTIADTTRYFALSVTDNTHTSTRLLNPSNGVIFRRWVPIEPTLIDLPDADSGRHKIIYRLSEVGTNVMRQGTIQIETAVSNTFANSTKTTFVTSTNTSNLISLTDKEVTIAGSYYRSDSSITYCRLIFTSYPNDGNPGNAYPPLTKVAYSEIFLLYPEMPTYRYRKNYLGINRIGLPSEDAALEVEATTERNKIYFRSADRIFSIDLVTGEVDGGIIDGGEY